MDINLKTLEPRHQLNRMLLNARSLVVKIGDTVYDGPAKLTDIGGGAVMLELQGQAEQAPYVAEPKRRGKRK